MCNEHSLPLSYVGYHGLSNNIKLYDVLVVPHLTKSLLSISKLIFDFSMDVIFSDQTYGIQNWQTKQVSALSRREKGLYVLDKGILG